MTPDEWNEGVYTRFVEKALRDFQVNSNPQLIVRLVKGIQQAYRGGQASMVVDDGPRGLEPNIIVPGGTLT